MDDGVTSMSSSSSMYSSASSKVTCRGGSRMIISSDAVVRMFVSFFSFEGFTSISSVREFSPTTIPSYTGSPGFTNIVPRSCKLKSAYATATPWRSATITPRLRPVALEHTEQPLPQLSTANELPLPPRERRVDDLAVHRDRRLLDRDAGEPLEVVRSRDRLPDLHAREPGQRHDFTGRGLFQLHPLQALEPEQLDHARLLVRAVPQRPGRAQRQHCDGVAHPHPAPLDSPDRDPPQIRRIVQGRDEHLQRPACIRPRRRDRAEDRLEQGL